MSERFIGPFTREMAQFIEDVSRCGPVTQNDLRKLWPDAEEARKAFETLDHPRHCVDGIERREDQ